MAIAAQGVCEGAVNPDVYDTTNIDIFDEHPTLGISCSWNYGPNSFVYQSSNAYRNDGAVHRFRG